MKKILVVGRNITVCDNFKAFFESEGIDFIMIDELVEQSNLYDLVIVINEKTELSELQKIIRNELENKPFIIKEIPRFNNEIKVFDLPKDFDKPFYVRCDKKGGKKNSKRFGR